ncbi:hypothetical protein [Halorussus caseinilyticus]|uniref:Uncharacterized protein n=1 Tax=Halorussus caseinilyticus TaxID=3034025 RepID=A0ABD5WJW1_9EURY|nr:hypothetical protein [Halorussus sp. DT72]
MTRTNRTDAPPDDRTTDRRTTRMGDVSHTHPYAEQGALDRLFERGPVVAADGGEREAYDPEEDDESERDRMKDVNHTPPHGEGADRVFERGGERVVSEE